MVFSSPIFLFGFLPIALLWYFFTPNSAKNIVLLCISLLFYAWGEVFYIGVMIVSIVSNYIFGRLIFRALEKDRSLRLSKVYLSAGISFNIALLSIFKYANFIVDNLNALGAIFNLPSFTLVPVHLPLGISFFTFQAVSYLCDVYRRQVEAQANIFNLALYIALFPQLIAGPIVRYADISKQISSRVHTFSLMSAGVQRFTIGLAKKMLLANPMGEVADNVFDLSANDLTMPLAWIGIFSYTLQIYYDFSGYSDMAIGLGHMFGFKFRENFNYPYIARSLREFWRRWHISLSSWFRDYLYIPLGGSKVSAPYVYRNLLIVFLLTGLWHGASWNFVIWGVFHGAFLTAEHMGGSKILEKMGAPVRHLYVIGVVVIAWVFFRADNLYQALKYLHAMFNMAHWHTTTFHYAQVLSDEFIYVFVSGLLFCAPVYSFFAEHLIRLKGKISAKASFCYYIPKVLLLSTLLFLSILKISSSSYNPFIYYRF